jgi:hypothetical protein|tara:strand:- start:48 stop:599 length:552 start_codon:yes stop_codon:yes gene_type:complete
LRYSQSILDKALLSEEQKELNRLLRKLLNNVYTFALIKERWFFKSALDEYERLKKVALHEANGNTEDLDQEDLVSQINHQSITQLDNLHLEFFNNFKLFKDSLEKRQETNFKYLRCRLDFNMYYQMRQLQEMGMDDDLEDYDDEADSQYENVPVGDNQMAYGSQEDDEEDIGVDDGEDDDDEG